MPISVINDGPSAAPIMPVATANVAVSVGLPWMIGASAMATGAVTDLTLIDTRMTSGNPNNAASPNADDDKQRLTFRFLRLPTLDRYQIALTLGLMREGDDALPPNTVFLEVFRRAVQAQRLADLWDETEQRHDDPAPTNPFRNS